MTTRLPSPFAIGCFSSVDRDVVADGAVFVFDVQSLAAPEKTGEAPEWIKLAPRGRFVARDGREIEINPEALVARFVADGVDVPIDLDHATVRKAMFGDAAPALAWIKELAAKPDGVHGRVEWLDAGRETVARRTHRYVSPSLKLDETGKAIWLHSAALVAAPAIAMPALASAQHTKQEPTSMNLLKIALALGLPETADETACLSAIGSRVDRGVHDQTLQTLSTTSAELQTLKDGVRKEKVTALLDGALAAKKILPAQRAEFETLCATDDGLASVTKLIEATAPGLAPSGLDEKKPGGGVTTLSAEDRDVMKMLGVSEEEYRKANGLAAV